jgi:hypothetical protein
VVVMFCLAVNTDCHCWERIGDPHLAMAALLKEKVLTRESEATALCFGLHLVILASSSPPIILLISSQETPKAPSNSDSIPCSRSQYRIQSTD